LKNRHYTRWPRSDLDRFVLAKLEAAVMDVLKTPAVWAKISANGVYAPQDAKAFRAQIEKDIAYWGAEIKKLGIQAE